MKKHVILAVIALAIAPFMAFAQTPVKKKMTPEEQKEWEKMGTEENSLNQLSAADKRAGREQAQLIAAYVVKALLHRSDPSAYPLEKSGDNLEKTALDLVDNFSPATLTKAKLKVTRLMADPLKRDTVLGKFKNLDFKKATITPEIKKLHNFKLRPVNRTMDDGADVEFERPEILMVGKGPNSVPVSVPAFSKLDFVLRAVHCVDETNPESGDDDMVVGGLLVGASGNAKASRSIVSCHFDDDEYCNHGSIPMGSYSLSTTNAYPKVFYFILQLIEVDTDEADAASALSDVMKLVAGMVATFNAPIGAIVAAVAEAVDIFAGWLIDDDAFYPYGITLNLPNQNHFGSDGRSANKATANISDHGGTYRIGYYWQLRN